MKPSDCVWIGRLDRTLTKDISDKPNKLSVFNPGPVGELSNGVNFVVWPSCGSERGSFDGIPAKSNGKSTTTGESCAGSPLWQCIEYVKRFYADGLGIVRAKQWTGHAKYYFESARKDVYRTDEDGKLVLDKSGKPILKANNKMLDAYPNGETMAPQARDIVVFDGGDFGHVAIIKNIESGCVGGAATKIACQVTVIEQNWSKDAYGTLTLTRSSNSTYVLARANSSFKVIGWLRAPDANPNPIETGSVVVAATLDGAKWPSSGTASVVYSIAGPNSFGFDGMSVPRTVPNLAPGQYIISYISGGPSNTSLVGIGPCFEAMFTKAMQARISDMLEVLFPTCTVPLNAGQTLTVTLQFKSNSPPSATCVSINATQGIAIVPTGLVATGGTGAPYTFSAHGLPDGVNVSTNGVVSGTPTVRGYFSYTVAISDKDGHASSFDCSISGQIATK